jgi:hypothetical protein
MSDVDAVATAAAKETLRAFAAELDHCEAAELTNLRECDGTDCEDYHAAIVDTLSHVATLARQRMHQIQVTTDTPPPAEPAPPTRPPTPRWVTALGCAITAAGMATSATLAAVGVWWIATTIAEVIR